MFFFENLKNFFFRLLEFYMGVIDIFLGAEKFSEKKIYSKTDLKNSNSSLNILILASLLG